MIAAERIGDRGGRFDAELVRAFILTALDHDAARDAVDELVFDHVVAGRFHPSTVAASLRPIVEEIVGAATSGDWQVIADRLIAEARELEESARSGSGRSHRLSHRVRQILLMGAAKVREGLLGVRLVVEKVSHKFQAVSGVVKNVRLGQHPDS